VACNGPICWQLFCMEIGEKMKSLSSLGMGSAYHNSLGGMVIAIFVKTWSSN
jgi:hypothetical protein